MDPDANLEEQLGYVLGCWSRTVHTWTWAMPCVCELVWRWISGSSVRASCHYPGQSHERPLTSYEELQVQDLVAYVKSRGGTGRVLRFNDSLCRCPQGKVEGIGDPFDAVGRVGEVTLTLPEREVPS